MNSPSVLDPVEVQIPHHVSEANKKYVDLILNNMVRGIVLSVTDGNIYAERVCTCTVFVYSPVLSADGVAEDEYVLMKKLGRREKELIFDYNDFLAKLHYHRAGHQQARPSFEVILAFGQQLRPGALTSSLLVWCRVASCRAWFELNLVSFPHTSHTFIWSPTWLLDCFTISSRVICFSCKKRWFSFVNKRYLGRRTTYGMLYRHSRQ